MRKVNKYISQFNENILFFLFCEPVSVSTFSLSMKSFPFFFATFCIPIPFHICYQQTNVVYISLFIISWHLSPSKFSRTTSISVAFSALLLVRKLKYLCASLQKLCEFRFQYITQKPVLSLSRTNMNSEKATEISVIW